MMVVYRLPAHLVQLQAHQADRQCCRSSNGRDDFPSNEFRLMSVRLCNGVIGCAKIRGSGDEVDVMVGIVIFLKIDRVEAEAG